MNCELKQQQKYTCVFLLCAHTILSLMCIRNSFVEMLTVAIGRNIRTLP